MEIPFNLLQCIKDKKPLIHCITNPISINQCANAILALGALPIMAEHPKEVSEITPTAEALLINLGNITDARIKSAKIALKTARKCGIPVVLDAVGVACSALRLKLANKLIKSGGVCILKGNYSEIYTLAHPDYKSAGVDASPTLTAKDIMPVCKELAAKYNCVVLASGKRDIVCSKDRLAVIENGTPALGSITGTGCMQGAMVATFASQRQYFEAALLGALALGISGEMAEGEGNYASNLMDSIGKLTEEDIKNRMEVTEIEEF